MVEILDEEYIPPNSEIKALYRVFRTQVVGSLVARVAAKLTEAAADEECAKDMSAEAEEAARYLIQGPQPSSSTSLAALLAATTPEACLAALPALGNQGALSAKMGL